MKTFICKLIHDGIVKELFYREGKSADTVKEDLEFFQWPKGEWTIEECEG